MDRIKTPADPVDDNNFGLRLIRLCVRIAVFAVGVHDVEGLIVVLNFHLRGAAGRVQRRGRDPTTMRSSNTWPRLALVADATLRLGAERADDGDRVQGVEQIHSELGGRFEGVHQVKAVKTLSKVIRRHSDDRQKLTWYCDCLYGCVRKTWYL